MSNSNRKAEWRKANLKYEDPNRYISRALGVFLMPAANYPMQTGMGAGQTRGTSFAAKSLEHFELLKVAISKELMSSGVFKSTDEFEIRPKRNADDGKALGGMLIPKLPRSLGNVKNRDELNRRTRIAYNYTGPTVNAKNRAFGKK